MNTPNMIHETNTNSHNGMEAKKIHFLKLPKTKPPQTKETTNKNVANAMAACSVFSTYFSTSFSNVSTVDSTLASVLAICTCSCWPPSERKLSALSYAESILSTSSLNTFTALSSTSTTSATACGNSDAPQ